MNTTGLRTKGLRPGFGIEVHNFPLHPTSLNQNARLIEDLVKEYGFLVIRKTNLTDEIHIALARHLGDLDDVNPYNKAGNIKADASVVDRKSPSTQAGLDNALFHVDSSFNPRRAEHSLLLAHELPPKGTGGNSLEEMKVELVEKDYIACQSILHSKKLAAPEHFADIEPTDNPMGRHKLVQNHEPSGRMNLYLAAHIHHIENLAVPDSKALFERLFEHATQEKYRVTVEWEDVGDLVVWDNTCTMHRAMGGEFAHRYRRDMRRATVHDGSSLA
ncbi:hypothetical protein BDP55DRAFT_693534 [Colletotrichum godetiae]|uniref:TauD/TfdA-like domain-containing protein n=1 Tax=Colletotrichum godetiae TaxID=1209918 RepID=A0AAJ0EWG1_9PEZI|nr:uncharacterized protein BDP55DRAFT_693534 [Colletotrichum godetiae]KAK1676328.1 hypothetical protein BDP55DRAFT_693534 [Colletotrichum godetiae]